MINFINQPTGMDVVNTAIETAIAETKREQWENVNVAVAPSMISINSSEVLQWTHPNYTLD